MARATPKARPIPPGLVVVGLRVRLNGAILRRSHALTATCNAESLVEVVNVLEDLVVVILRNNVQDRIDVTLSQPNRGEAPR